jgi:deoxyribonuclease-4
LRTGAAPATPSGRTFEELGEVIDRAGGDKRIGVCLDSCDMFATGFDITMAADKVSEVGDGSRAPSGSAVSCACT